MPTTADLALAHAAAFDAAVGSGDWDGFAERFADDAEMVFVGVPAGPFRGRAAIAAAYAADPPAEGIEPGEVVATDEVAEVPFRWRESGGTGSMRLEYAADGLVRRLTVTFSQAGS